MEDSLSSYWDERTQVAITNVCQGLKIFRCYWGQWRKQRVSVLIFLSQKRWWWLHCSEDYAACGNTWELLQRFSSVIYRKDDVPPLCIGTIVSSINTRGDTSEFSVANLSNRDSKQTTQTRIKYFSISSHSSTYMEITICPTYLLWKLPVPERRPKKRKRRRCCSDRTRGDWKRIDLVDLDWILELNSLLWRC